MKTRKGNRGGFYLKGKMEEDGDGMQSRGSDGEGRDEYQGNVTRTIEPPFLPFLSDRDSESLLEVGQPSLRELTVE